MQKIDYSLLPKLKRPLKLFPKAPTWTVLPILLGIFILFALGFVLAFIILAAVSAFLGRFAFAPWVLFFVWIIVFTTRRNKRHKANFAAFIKQNDWQTGGLEAEIPFFKVNGFRSIGSEAECSGQLEGIPFSVFQIIKTNEHGSNEHNLPLRIFAAELPKDMPMIALFPRFLELLGAASPFKLNKVSLEGDFDSHMSLLIPEGSQIDALSYITPDVMEAIKNSNYGQVLILSGKYACVASNDTELTRQALEPLFGTAQVLLKELKEKQHVF